MYKDILNKSSSLIGQASDDGSTVFIATISPDGNTGNAIFFGDAPKMVKLLTSLIKLADQRNDGAVLRDTFADVFAKGILQVE